MTVSVKWHDGEREVYYDVDSITNTGEEILLISNTEADVSLWAAEVEKIEIGGLN